MSWNKPPCRYGCNGSKSTYDAKLCLIAAFRQTPLLAYEVKDVGVSGNMGHDDGHALFNVFPPLQFGVQASPASTFPWPCYQLLETNPLSLTLPKGHGMGKAAGEGVLAKIPQLP